MRVQHILVLALSLAFVSPVTIAQDKGLSKFLLIKLSREQSAVLCGSETFTQCMAFTEEQCLALSESAVEKCLEPLPERIDLEKLDNAAIEACPREIYSEAGHTDEKAQDCLTEAMKKP